MTTKDVYTLEATLVSMNCSHDNQCLSINVYSKFIRQFNICTIDKFHPIMVMYSNADEVILVLWNLDYLYCNLICAYDHNYILQRKKHLIKCGVYRVIL